jgi:hypothetical protein
VSRKLTGTLFENAYDRPAFARLHNVFKGSAPQIMALTWQEIAAGVEGGETDWCSFEELTRRTDEWVIEWGAAHPVS